MEKHSVPGAHENLNAPPKRRLREKTIFRDIYKVISQFDGFDIAR